jgi:hypothetical protein
MMMKNGIFPQDIISFQKFSPLQYNLKETRLVMKCYDFILNIKNGKNVFSVSIQMEKI